MKKLTGIIIFALMLFVSGTASGHYGQQGDITKSLKVEKNGSLDVHLSVGTIELITWNKDEMQIETKGLYDNDADNVKISQSGSAVKVSYDEGGHPDEIKFTISLPAQYNVTLRTSSGDIKVNGILKGELRASTAGGNIVLGNVEGLTNLNTAGGNIVSGDVTGNANFNTSGGNIASGDITGNASLNTSGGNIAVGNISGTADIRTNGGNIAVKNVGKELSATTYGGDIQVGRIDGNGTVSTYGGDIHIENVTGNADANTQGGDIYLSGATGKVKANTMGGDLTLNKISGSVDARTRSGSVSLELLSAGNSTIQASNGSVKLYLKDDIKATINAKIKMREWKKKMFHLSSDFNPEQKPEIDDSKHEIRATIPVNGGGPAITIETVNSDIEIKKLENKNK